MRGRSGSGKSTLLNIIAGLHLPDKGQVLLDDLPVHALSESKRDRIRAEQIGYVFQTFNLLSPLTVLENIILPGSLTGFGRPDGEDHARKILVDLDLADHINKHPFELSVGQRQRVAVARAVFKQPTLLLADEPTANLDAESTDTVVRAFHKLNEDGTTFIFATHDPALDGAFDGSTIDLGHKEASR
ncbi:MAG: ATP-binding cassette domain-containing protein [Deltaproteobacteria bacterium]|nr:ATP-binding cassette domain-containing protein [Deltaproteobacteria bacterium]